ncbi:GntR family transcriptional regulator [Longimycelium tulufanense]|uniref:GntR family transcriptional regulator n=1 Tax=Longimycelium tulufanense TaxID=907463 RepID=A0A8J3CC78_9PSEU|nr:GntR family transcriptional regulator [Longimycelium tulufanense]GGM46219.1 GntR family transcriptional regulator [Longimycelium tulufanense]
MTGHRVPKYEQLRRRLLHDIERLAPHQPLPTERDLALRHRVSRATVRHALEALVKAGAVYRVQGAGTFVADQIISKSVSLTSFTEDMAGRGLRPGTRVLVADLIGARGRICQELRLGSEDEVVRLVRLRLADEAPMCLETAYLPAARVPGLLDHDMTGSLYSVLDTKYGIIPVVADQVVEALVLGDSDAALLGVPPGTAALRVRRLATDQRGVPVERTTTLYRADRYDIRFTIARQRC